MFNPDYREMLHILLEENAEFQIVGAYALAAHGYPRATGDIDIWVQASLNNAQSVYRALVRFGAPVADIGPEDLSHPGMVYQIGVAPCRIDIINDIDGVKYEQTVTDKMQVDIDGLLVPFIGKVHLIANKLSTGRLKDRADVEELLKLG